MQGENRPRVPFDDRAALAELERLQRSIQEYRKRRGAAEGEFEQFVGSFQKPAVAVSPEEPLPGFFVGTSSDSQRTASAARGAEAPRFPIEAPVPAPAASRKPPVMGAPSAPVPHRPEPAAPPRPVPPVAVPAPAAAAVPAPN